MKKRKFDIVFVVLVYRNTDDLIDFFHHNHIKRAHTIVVNSYYDEVSESTFRKIAEENHASFISVPNKGYGAGNNRGIEYALRHFEFEFLVISNADIQILRFDMNILNLHRHEIIAPKIIAKNGRLQNPSNPFKPSKLYSYLKYRVYRDDRKSLIIMFYALSRLKKVFYHLIKPIKHHVFSAHGAFVILPIECIVKMIPLFDERMFLFNEEEHLGFKARQVGIKTVYIEDVEVLHKEDGSVGLEYKNDFDLMKQSYMILYNNWY